MVLLLDFVFVGIAVLMKKLFHSCFSHGRI